MLKIEDATTSSVASLKSEPGPTEPKGIGLLFLIGGQVVGVMIVQQGVQLLIANKENIAALYPAINAFKTPHAICLHAIQALCATGLAADHMLKNRRRGAWTVTIAALALAVVLGISLARLP